MSAKGATAWDGASRCALATRGGSRGGSEVAGALVHERLETLFEVGYATLSITNVRLGLPLDLGIVGCRLDRLISFHDLALLLYTALNVGHHGLCILRGGMGVNSDEVSRAVVGREVERLTHRHDCKLTVGRFQVSRFANGMRGGDELSVNKCWRAVGESSHPVLPGDGGVGRSGCADEGQKGNGRNVDGCRCSVRMWDSRGGPCGVMDSSSKVEKGERRITWRRMGPMRGG